MAEETKAKMIINLDDFHEMAKECMDKVDYDYYASAAEDETTMRRNYDAWRQMRIWPRFMIDVSAVSMATSIFGVDLKMPVMVPPMAMQKLAHPDGEIGLARAAAAAGALYCITQQATTKMETICEKAPGPKFFQMYISSNRETTEGLIARAEALPDVKAIVVTVDSPMLGRRERDIRNKFTPASRGVEIVNWKEEKKSGGETKVQHAVSSRIGSRDAAFSWKDLAWLKAATRLPILLKGIEHPADADLAVRHGCSGVWVSNHGGRQLDDGPATAEALPGVVAAVAGRVPVIVDGGVRRGGDILKGLALGAAIVCVGRPLLWALAANGEQGARLAMDIVRDELSATMALSGVPDVPAAAARGDLVQRPGDAPPSLAKL